MRFHAADDFYDADNPANIDIIWNADAIHSVNVLGSVFRTRSAGVDEKRPAVLCPPRAILDIFVAIYDEPRPRLLQRQRAELCKTWRPAG